jgi:hypothetical protein
VIGLSNADLTWKDFALVAYVWCSSQVTGNEEYSTTEQRVL